MDCTVHGILQVRTPEWVAVPFSRGILPIQGSNPGLLHCRQILYQLIHQGSPRVLEWVAYPFTRGSCRQILYQLSYQGSPQLTENTASPSHALSVRCPKGLPSCDYCILADDTLDLLYCSCFFTGHLYFLARPHSLQDLSSLTRR